MRQGGEGPLVLVGAGAILSVAAALGDGWSVGDRALDLLAVLAAVAGLCGFLAVLLYRARTRGAETRHAVQRRAASALAELDDGIAWELSPDGVITDISPLVEAVAGHAPADLIGVPFHAVMPPCERQRAEHLLAAAAKSGHGWSGEHFVYIMADGTQIPLCSTGIAHVGEKGRVLGFSGVLRRPDAPEAVIKQRAEVRARVNRLLESGELTVVFQPIVDLAAGRVAGAEALTRFDAEPRQSPDRWFADAAATGRGEELELLAVKNAFAAAKQLPDDVYLSINLSPATLVSERLLPMLRAAQWDPRRLVVEITEHVEVSDYPPVVRAIACLRGRGVRIAVDDAGSGYASFQHILALRPDLIKLDRSLVAGINADPDRRALVTAVASFATEIGAEVVAEGIETAGELDTLRALRLRYAQGYLIGRPATPSTRWAELDHLDADAARVLVR